jgi:hypothetical protein
MVHSISNNVLINHPEQLHPLDMPEKPSGLNAELFLSEDSVTN